MKDLKGKWGDFLWMAVDPWFLVFVVLTVTSLIASFLFNDNAVTSNTLAIAGSITGGIAGSIFQNQLSKKNGETTLEKKGQSAVRNLEAIETQIASLKSWVGSACNGEPKDKDKRIQLAEVDRHLSTMGLHIKSGYEDWIDVLPQLRDESEREKKIEQALRSSYDALLDEQLKLAQASNAEEKAVLQKQIDQLEKQFERLRRDNGIVGYSRLDSAGSIGRSLSGSYYNSRPGLMRRFPCNECGKPSEPMPHRYAQVALCLECRSKQDPPKKDKEPAAS